MPTNVELLPKFEDLEQPETLVKHVQELTKTTATPHAEILSQLLEQLEEFDFETEANPHNAEHFKLSNKHYLVLSIEHVLEVAEKNRWGLCKKSPGQKHCSHLL